MPSARLDHLVVAAPDLDAGADFVRATLGVDVPPGGRHEMMGTHNRVMALGEAVYLEIIAVNPEMTPPARPRWFGLDDPAVRRSLDQGPKLLTWAINTDDLETLVSASPIGVGEVTAASRDDLRWKVALTDDGRLGAAGFFPLCIQWQMDFHPASRMPDLGCRLRELVLYHPYPAWLRGVLDGVGAGSAVTVRAVGDPSESRLAARIDTPSGEVELSGW